MYLRFLKYAVVEPKADFLQRYNLIQDETSSIIDTNKNNNLMIVMITSIGYLFRFSAVRQIQVSITVVYQTARQIANIAIGFAKLNADVSFPVE